MLRIHIHAVPFPKERIGAVLEANGIQANVHANRYFAHPLFATEDYPKEVQVMICSLHELGLRDGAVLEDILKQVREKGFGICRPATGLFLRLAWKEQPNSVNSVLTGQHRAPDGSVTVLSPLLEADDTFPKGLYLRKTGDVLWLRGYLCDASFPWSPDDLFAFEELEA